MTPLKTEDIPVISRFLPAFGLEGANHSVAALVTRAVEPGTKFAVVNDHLLVRWRPVPGAPCQWMMPLGKVPDAGLAVLLDDAGRDKAGILRFWGVVPVMRPVLEEIFPGRCLEVTTSEDWWDYLYEREAVATLAGRALHGKRNFVKRFWAAHPEARAIEAALDNRLALGLAGDVLAEGGTVLGFAYGAMTGTNVFAVHIEKARRDVAGAYPTLAQALARTLPASVRWINREEDLGIAGLKKAKTDWAPCAKLQKGWVSVS